jgi:hypothetical protein
MVQLTIDRRPAPPRGPSGAIFELEPVSHPRWPARMEALARAMGAAQLPVASVFERARRALGWSERRTRCVLALGLDVRFAYDPARNRWRAVKLPVARVEWRWCRQWQRWVVVGLEQAFERLHEEEVHALGEVSERFQMAVRAVAEEGRLL